MINHRDILYVVEYYVECNGVFEFKVDSFKTLETALNFVSDLEKDDGHEFASLEKVG